MDASKTRDERMQMVVQANEFIRFTGRSQLSAREQDIVLYLMSKIRPEDKDLKEINFSISEFSETVGIYSDSGRNYADIKAAIKVLRDKSAWVDTQDGYERLVSWISKAVIKKGTGTMTIRFDEDLEPFLVGLVERGNYTQAELINFIALRSKYGKRLYEFLRSYASSLNTNETLKVFDISELKKLLGSKYERYPDFSRYVLDISVKEINAYTDISVYYEPVKVGRKYEKIKFGISRKENRQTLECLAAGEKRIGGE
jgi:plasmid replication initiation protein